MLIARTVMAACLTVLKWMLWLVAVLLLVLIAMQHLRGEAGQTGAQLAGAGLSFATGWLCGILSRWFAAVR